MSLVVRPALPADHAVLVEFNRAMAWETEQKALDVDILGRGVRGVFEDPRRGFYLVAARDGAVEGALLVTYEWSDWRCGDWWWLQSVYVRPPARGQGVFRALFDAVVARARRRRRGTAALCRTAQSCGPAHLRTTGHAPRQLSDDGLAVRASSP